MTQRGLDDLQLLDDLNLLSSNISRLRGERWDHSRVSWDAHARKLAHENQFVAEYRMELPTHQRLVQFLSPL